jgi:hypothetical protein
MNINGTTTSKPERKPAGVMEKRAAAACAEIAADGSGFIRVEWTKSRTWGRCSKIDWRGHKAAHAGGCGYDKLSAVLADFLCWLPGVELRGYAGAGWQTIAERLKVAGWELRHDYDAKAEAGFTLRRIK